MGGKVDNEEKRELVTKVCLFFGFVAGAFFLALAITTFIIWRWPRMLENGGLQYLILGLATLTTAAFAFAFACLSKWLGQWMYKRDQQKQIRQLRQRKYESDTLFQVWKAVNLFLPRLLKWEEEGKGYPKEQKDALVLAANAAAQTVKGFSKGHKVVIMGHTLRIIVHDKTLEFWVINSQDIVWHTFERSRI